jgi:hypothetical protein
MTGKPEVNYGPALCAAGVPDLPGATYLLRLTVGNHGNGDCVLFSSSKCALCVLDARKLIVPILP